MFALCYGTVVLSVCPVRPTLVYCGQTVGWIEMPLGMEVDHGPGDIVLDGDPAKGHDIPHFSAHVVSAHVYCGQTVAHLSNC